MKTVFKSPSLLWLFVISCLFAGASSLDANDFLEGTCGHYTAQRNFNGTWFANNDDWFISGGSKYHLYRVASGKPEFPEMREFEFLYDSCLQVNINLTTLEAGVSGFGGEALGFYDLTPISNGVFDFDPRSTPANDPERKFITLTDNKSFVFFVNCWSATNVVGWNILSLTPTLPRATQKLIENHAVSLGFDRERVLFLRYDSCHLNNSGERERPHPRGTFTRIDNTPRSWNNRFNWGWRY